MKIEYWEEVKEELIDFAKKNNNFYDVGLFQEDYNDGSLNRNDTYITIVNIKDDYK